MPNHLVTCHCCGSDNRVPSEKEGLPGRCGNCRARLPALYLRPQQATDADFDAFVAGYPGTVIAEFWAPW